jgi:hypothetical protein
MVSTLEKDVFDNRVTEIGGPDVVAMEALLLHIRTLLKRAAPRVMHLPAAPLAALLGTLEPLALPLLPFTAGQLASFTNAGTAQFSAKTGLHEMLALSLS